MLIFYHVYQIPIYLLNFFFTNDIGFLIEKNLFQIYLIFFFKYVESN